MSKGGIALLSHFNKIDRIHYSTFDVERSMLDVQRSMFNVHFLFYQTGRFVDQRQG
jgi:hypothetical protein